MQLLLMRFFFMVTKLRREKQIIYDDEVTRRGTQSELGGQSLIVGAANWMLNGTALRMMLRVVASV